MNYRAQTCKLVGDEDGWTLEIETDEGESLVVNIHSCAWEFYATLDGLREEVRDVAWAKARVAAGLGPNGEWIADDGGYEPDNPKNPKWIDSMASWADDLRKREREQRADHINPPGQS